MLKPGTKRKRTRVEMQDFREEEKNREDAVANKNKEIKSLQNELEAVVT
jgi:hypothetical protein